MPENWAWQFGTFLVAFIAVTSAVNWLLRKILNVERKEVFSYSSNFFTDTHQKVHDYFRWGGAIGYTASLAVFGFEKGSLYFLAVSIVLGGFQEVFNAYMEKKHSDNPNDYIYTLLKSAVFAVVLVTCAAAFLPDLLKVMWETLH